MYAIVLLATVITISLALYRAARGPTVFDRILALNMVGTKTVLLISVVSFLIGRTDFIDLALLYSLMNFIGMVAVLRFSKYGTFADEDVAAAAPPAVSER
jgi:multicomponent Na+:H+ antiporter subunit F